MEHTGSQQHELDNKANPSGSIVEINRCARPQTPSLSALGLEDFAGAEQSRHGILGDSLRWDDDDNLATLSNSLFCPYIAIQARRNTAFSPSIYEGIECTLEYVANTRQLKGAIIPRWYSKEILRVSSTPARLGQNVIQLHFQGPV